MEPFAITRLTGRVTVVGEVDLAAHEQLRRAIVEALAGTGTDGVTVDLAAATLFDSTAIGILVEGMNAAARAGVPYRVVNPQGVVRQVLEITGLLEALCGDKADPGASAAGALR